MTKPMYCPMSFANSELTKLDIPPVKCTPYCAWAVKGAIDDNYACSIAMIAKKETYHDINFRPLEDDAE